MIISSFARNFAKALCAGVSLFVLLLLVVAPAALKAQTGGQAGIQGTVTDPTGAAIPHATVTATNNATGVISTRETTGEGLFTISPILPGTYTVSVKAQGFNESVQQNFTIDALVMTPLNITMKIGDAGTTVTVTEAPPQLQTTNATLGVTLENETYSNLPLQMNNAQRDPTAFGALAPGAQGGARLPIIGGTGNYLGQLYLDGVPAETISQQGDNRLVSTAVSIEAIEQMQVVTSTPPAEYSGAGAENFTIKSGGLKYHGQVAYFYRNDELDTWSFTNKWIQRAGAGVPVCSPGTTTTTVGSVVTTNAPRAGCLQKPVDHQNELSLTFGGHVPGTRRVFFFVAYDRFHSRRQANPAGYNVPTVLEKTGNFTELNNCPPSPAPQPANCVNGIIGTGITGTGASNPAFLYDPTTTVCGATCTRQPFQGTVNGTPTNNVIPASYISTISKNMQQFLPDPTNPAVLTNNFIGTVPTGFDNHLLDYRVDFDINSRHRISTVGAFATQGYLNNYSAPYLPLPYVGGDLATIFPKVFDVEDSYTISNSMVNQLKYGFTRYFQNIVDATHNVSKYDIGTFGATNLLPGQAGAEFPSVSFAANTATNFFGSVVQQTWTNGASAQTQLTFPNNFTLLDNLQWTKGRHQLTFGLTYQWQEINNDNPATLTGLMSLGYGANSTQNFGSGTSLSGSGGYSYASFLLGAVSNQSQSVNYVHEVGGRYHPFAPYVEDTWKVNSKLTVDAGLRWDYLPPYHEVKDRWSFLNPNLTNAATGTPGALQFAGSYGGAGVSCGCRTPVATYWKNFGPRVGVTYAFLPTTVLRLGFGHVFSQGGGVGGRANAFQGAGQTGFSATITSPAEVTSGPNTGPSYYLNNSAYFTTLGKANTALFGGAAIPGQPVISAASQILNTGNYLNGSNAFVSPAGVSFADPYFSGRAPDFSFYNAGIEQALTHNLTLAINYAGNQSHHLVNSTSSGGNLRGYWSNQLDPKYLAALATVTDTTGKIPILTAPATSANVVKAQAAMSGLTIPAFFQSAAAVNTSATIAQGLVAFPQYSGVSDIYGSNTGNFSYNSLQVTLEQRFSNGLSFNFNYTWSRNIGDDGTFRSGFNIPAAALSGGGQDWHQDRIERSQSVVSTPHSIHAYGVYQLPFGKNHLGGSNLIVRNLVGGWQISGIYTYADGTAMALSTGGCVSPGQGQCMPNINPAYAGNPRINGSFGTVNGKRSACALGFTGCTAVPYFDSKAFSAVVSSNPAGNIQLLGNAPRTGAYNLSNPGAQNIDTALRRTFKIHEAMNFQFEADCLNTWNHTIFGSPSGALNNNFGITTTQTNSPRDWQFAGHFNF